MQILSELQRFKIRDHDLHFAVRDFSRLYIESARRFDSAPDCCNVPIKYAFKNKPFRVLNNFAILREKKNFFVPSIFSVF